MSMTPLPPMDRTSPTFRADLDAFFLTRLPNMVVEANALQVDVTTKANATTTAVNTAMAAGLANAATNAASAAADRVQTGLDRVATGQDRTQTGLDRAAVAAGLASIADGPVYNVAGATGSVVLKTINGTALVGAGNLVLDPSIYRVPRTANTMIALADKVKLIDITAGTFSQTFDAAATLTSGWFCYVRNSGTGVVTLDPNGSETIDGLATLSLYPGHTRLIQCDGVALRSILLSGEQVMVVVDEKPSGGAGGTNVSGVQTRVLNTVRSNTIPGATLGTNSVDLPAGIYEILASCPGYAVVAHRARIYNVTAAASVLGGTSEVSDGSAGIGNRSFVSGQVTLAVPSTIRVEHYTQISSGSSSSLGYPASSGAPETYTQITIRKIS